MEAYKEIEGTLHVYDEDEFLWPDGMWMPVCKECKRGPLNNGGVYCGDFNGIKPGECIDNKKHG